MSAPKGIEKTLATVLEANTRLADRVAELEKALRDLLNDEHALSPIYRDSIVAARAAIARARGDQ